MPLKCGDPSGNISREVRSGRPQRQAIAMSLENERRCHRKKRRRVRRRTKRSTR